MGIQVNQEVTMFNAKTRNLEKSVVIRLTARGDIITDGEHPNNIFYRSNGSPLAVDNPLLLLLKPEDNFYCKRCGESSNVMRWGVASFLIPSVLLISVCKKEHLYAFPKRYYERWLPYWEKQL